MKVVLLYSTDGFDLDVLENQRQLYLALGCKVIWGGILVPCDLIVVLRCMREDVIIAPSDTPLMFLDYSGQDVYEVFENTLSTNKFCITSQKSLEDGKFVYFGHPYVSIESQSSNLSELQYTYVHIGNYKPKRTINNINSLFVNYCNAVNCNVWGKGWEDVPRNGFTFHGPLRPEKVSDVYSRSRFALGVKHDFQIGRAISGRYWHAPLNGCVLFVEDPYLLDEIPGIYLYGYEGYIPGREEIQRGARDYWEESNKLQKKLSIQLIQKVKTKFWKNIFIFYTFRIYSKLYENYRLRSYGKK